MKRLDVIRICAAFLMMITGIIMLACSILGYGSMVLPIAFFAYILSCGVQVIAFLTDKSSKKDD